MTIRHWNCLGTLASLAMIGSNAPASADDLGGYIRISGGRSNIDVRDYSERAYRGRAPFDDEQTEFWSIAAGYRINRYFAIESSYVDFGEVKLSLPSDLDLMSTITTFTRTNDATIAMTGASLAVVGMLPINRWELFVRLGALRAETEISQRFTTITNILAIPGFTPVRRDSITRDSESTTEYIGSVGVGYGFGEHYNIKLELTHAPDVGDEDVTTEGDADSLALAFEYRF